MANSGRAIGRTRGLLVMLVGCGLLGCEAAVDPNMPEYAGVRGYPTIVAQTATFEDVPGGTCLNLRGAKLVLGTDGAEQKDLSIFRQKTVLLVRSRQRATFFSTLADAGLSTQLPSAPVPHPCELDPGDYALVNVAADGSLSAGETRPTTSVRLFKSAGP